MTWNIDVDNGTIDLEVDQEPVWARVNYAQSWPEKRRDFRVVGLATEACDTFVIDDYCVQPSLYKSRSVKPQKVGDKWQYHVKMDAPEKGYLAFYLELKFDRKNTSGPNGLRLSSEMNVIPKGYPFEDCHGLECKGTLV